MLEKIYEKNLEAVMVEVERCTFPELVRFCRELMGLKQFACSDYLGFANPRYKKLELGRFTEPLEMWEMERLQTFFHLPPGLLQRKQKTFITGLCHDRMGVCKEFWNESEDTRGERASRAQEDFTRARGILD